MLKRASIGGFSLLAGFAMLGSARTIALGIALLAFGLTTLMLPSTLRGPQRN
ncbi:MAG: hypothetical protein ABEH59_08410 [Halobacteriales archaeon]